MPPKPFNPPRPSSKPGPSKPRGRPKASTSKSIAKDKVPAPKKARVTKPPTPQHEDEESDDPFASQPIVKSKPTSKTSTFKASTSNNGDPGSSDSEIEVLSSSPNKAPHIQEEEDDEDTDERTKIPDDLLSKIMHELFTEPNSRISKEANKAVGKYMDTFVREAVARVRYAEGSSGRGAGGAFWEVEDLEKMAPQLLLDF